MDVKCKTDMKLCNIIKAKHKIFLQSKRQQKKMICSELSDYMIWQKKKSLKKVALVVFIVNLWFETEDSKTKTNPKRLRLIPKD